jgi:hypothetical protein
MSLQFSHHPGSWCSICGVSRKIQQIKSCYSLSSGKCYRMLLVSVPVGSIVWVILGNDLSAGVLGIKGHNSSYVKSLWVTPAVSNLKALFNCYALPARRLEAVHGTIECGQMRVPGCRALGSVGTCGKCCWYWISDTARFAETLLAVGMFELHTRIFVLSQLGQQLAPHVSGISPSQTDLAIKRLPKQSSAFSVDPQHINGYQRVLIGVTWL